jgi:DNA-binding protein H-NS
MQMAAKDLDRQGRTPRAIAKALEEGKKLEDFKI